VNDHFKSFTFLVKLEFPAVVNDSTDSFFFAVISNVEMNFELSV
jgi:hypothetical protein